MFYIQKKVYNTNKTCLYQAAKLNLLQNHKVKQRIHLDETNVKYPITTNELISL